MTLRQILIGDFTLKRLVRSVAFLYAFFFVVAVFFPNCMIFQPPASSYAESKDILKLPTNDGETIAAAYLLAPTGGYTFFYTHGNAEDIGHSAPLREAFRELGFGVFAYDYRGYGLSTGTPSEDNAYADCELAFDYLTNTLHVPADKVIVYGRSLGAAMAIDVASKNDVAGLVVESAFVSAFRVLTRVPIFPFDKFRNMEKIRKVRCPVLVIHGDKDSVISLWQGKKLYVLANQPKWSYWVEGAGHNNLVYVAGDMYFAVLVDFAKELSKRFTTQTSTVN